ncbi:hypothetical protein [Streptomyces longwoodensis]|uniref:hypothetical protein n=1 Tax=Streptomyces longwoodensis TaxID=68231 RepID=UPI0033FD60D2
MALLEDARYDGSLAPGVAVEDVVTAVLAVTVGVQILSRQPDTAVEVSGTLDRFWRALLPQLIH